MIQSLWSAAAGMQAQQLKVDTIANNLANVNTTGFKASRVVFQDLAYVDLPTPGGAAAGSAAGPAGSATTAPAVPLQVGTGVGPAAIVRDFSPGMLEATGEPFDLAVDGPGFFRVRLADGQEGYTRNGHFTVDANRLLVDAAGNPLLTIGGQTITLPQGWEQVTVQPDGQVVARMPGGALSTVGQVGLAVFTNPAGLEAAGDGIYRATDASGQAQAVAPGSAGAGLVRQGFLEGSNVQVVNEMVNLIVAQRAYELNARAIQSADQMLEIANGLRR